MCTSNEILGTDLSPYPNLTQVFLRGTVPIHNSDMTNSPIRLETGGLGCPDCKYALDSVKSAFYLHDEYVGHFDSLSCSICRYHLFTSEGYKLAIETAKKFDVIKKNKEFEDLSEEYFTVYFSLHDSNRESTPLSLENHSNLVSGYNQPEELAIPTSTSPRKTSTRRTNYWILS